MRVSIDTNALYVTQAGVARYVRGLQKGLSEIEPDGFSFSECAWPVTNFAYRQPLRAIKTAYRELVWARFSAPELLLKQNIDLFHTTGSLIIHPPRAIAHVVTLHDLAVLRHPERFRPWLRYTFKRSLKYLPHVSRVICVSQFTADEAMKLLDLPAANIEVVYNGCDQLLLNGAAQEQKPAFEVPSEFFLFVGSLEPGKNLALLREVYVACEAGGTVLPPLLIVGARWVGVPGEGSPPESWRYLGHIPDSELIFLYRRAIALVFPSKYEGFGFPVVEAMSLGCPVICSAVASLPEVAGTAAQSSELSVKGYQHAMTLLAQDGGLRADLIERGRCQAQKFSWKKCAEQTVQVYSHARGCSNSRNRNSPASGAADL